MTALAHIAVATGLPTGLVLVGAVLLGLGFGSFLNVVVHRLPRGESLVRPRSRCPGCGAPVRPRDNVPLLGWLLLRGRCRDCAAPISPRYPLVEALGGGLGALAVLAAPDLPGALCLGGLLLTLTAVFFIDLDHQLILDVITLPGIALGLAFGTRLGTARLDAVIGCLGGYLVLWGVQKAYRTVRGVDGLGGGDVKLAAMLGAWLGWQGVLLTFLFGSFVGAVVGMTLASRGRAGARTALPYGVFLAPAAASVALWGPTIWNWYTTL
jgi:leader peptidase (prepilin peptidase)/N-methyltransferase